VTEIGNTQIPNVHAGFVSLPNSGLVARALQYHPVAGETSSRKNRMTQQQPVKQPALKPQVAGGQVEGEEEQEEFETGGMPIWLETAFPWMVSFMLHLGIFLIALFVYWAGVKAAEAEMNKEPIIIPNAVNADQEGDIPGGVPHPGTGGDPNRDAAQDRIKEVLKSDGWAQKESTDNVSSMLEGASADNDALFIATGSGGSVGKGAGGSGRGEGGPLAPYGTPGGGTGAGPKSNFYGNGGRAKRVCYILDHSGSMLDNFDFLREEAKSSIGKLAPIQFFNVVMVSENESVVLSKGQLVRATPDNVREFATKIAEYRAQGQNDDLLPPFQSAFEEAFRMKPELIYFLTDGHFDPKLAEVVNRLNADKKVKINTLAFVNKEPSYEAQLQKMAADNGGKYKFVAEKDLGK